MSKAKFKVGDFLRHKAASDSGVQKLLVRGVGQMAYAEGYTVILYELSFEKKPSGARDDSFSRVLLEESELEFIAD